MTSCTWAMCHERAVEVIDGYPMCADHVADHYRLQKPEKPDPEPPKRPALGREERDEAVRQLHARRLSDTEIAGIVGCSRELVTWTRKRLGLPVVGARRGRKPGVIVHGTPQGARAHWRRGEVACVACARAYSASRRKVA